MGKTLTEIEVIESILKVRVAPLYMYLSHYMGRTLTEWRLIKSQEYLEQHSSTLMLLYIIVYSNLK